MTDQNPLQPGDVFHFYRSRLDAGYTPVTLIWSDATGYLYEREEGDRKWSNTSNDHDITIVTRAHRPVEQEAVAWQVRTSDGFGGFLTDTYPHNGKQLIRQGYTVTPLGPLAASPPSRALSPDERERVARFVDPVAWAFHDRHAANPIMKAEIAHETRNSFRMVDQIASILSLQPEGEANG